MNPSGVTGGAISHFIRVRCNSHYDNDDDDDDDDGNDDDDDDNESL